MASIRTVEYKPSRKVHAAPGFNLTLCGALATTDRWVEVATHSSPHVVSCLNCRRTLIADGELPHDQEDN